MLQIVIRLLIETVTERSTRVDISRTRDLCWEGLNPLSLSLPSLFPFPLIQILSFVSFVSLQRLKKPHLTSLTQEWTITRS